MTFDDETLLTVSEWSYIWTLSQEENLFQFERFYETYIISLDRTLFSKRDRDKI